MVGEVLDRYTKSTALAVLFIPVAPDIVVEIVDQSAWAPYLRMATVVGVLAVLLGYWRWQRTRSTRLFTRDRQRMTQLGWYDVLILPLSLNPEYRIDDRHEAESVPELLIDHADGLRPSTVVLVRSPQVNGRLYQRFVDNLAEHRPSITVVEALINDAYDADTVYAEVSEALAEHVRLTDKTVAIDLTGGNAIMSIGLAKLAVDLNADCVYVRGNRGEHGRIVLGTQDRQLVPVTALLGASR